MDLLLLCLVSVLSAGFAIAVLYYLSTRIRRVSQGYVAVIERLEKFARTAGPGLYFLWPTEDEVATIYVRQREATAVVPNVFTEGRLPVLVNLRYSYSLDPMHMNRDEVYYTDADRLEQQRTLLKRVFQDLMYQMENMPAPGGNKTANGSRLDRVNVDRLFSPFAGWKARTLQTVLEPAVREALRPHGIIVTDAPVLINGLTLPPEISGAYIDLLSTDFNSSARSDFIRRVRKAAPKMTEAGLIQLFNIVQNPSADIHSVFSGGMLNTEVLFPGKQSDTRHVVQPDDGSGGGSPGTGAGTPTPVQPSPAAQSLEPVQQSSPQQASTPQGSGRHASTLPDPSATKPPTATGAPPTPVIEEGMDPDYPLTEEDSDLLKTTRAEVL
jgi:regulator of protease activity HflC (stomatin/prohibitin superfamily)